MLVNIIGIDGCGKTEQIKKSIKWISREYSIPACAITKYDIDKYPECGFLKFPAADLHDYVCSMKGYARALFFIWALAVSFSGYDAEKTEVAFTDGYWYKYLISEGILGINEKWFQKVCAFFPKPDVTILLDVDPALVLTRRKSFQWYECGM